MNKLAPIVALSGTWIAAHRRPLGAAFATLLGGFAVTAFGVAPLLPDPSDLPQRVVVDELQPQGLRSQLDALAEHDLALSRTELTRAGDTVDALLRRLGVADASAAAFLRSDPIARRLVDGKPALYVCRNSICRPPIVDAAAFDP